jgi:hypothetical protein
MAPAASPRVDASPDFAERAPASCNRLRHFCKARSNSHPRNRHHRTRGYKRGFRTDRIGRLGAIPAGTRRSVRGERHGTDGRRGGVLDIAAVEERADAGVRVDFRDGRIVRPTRRNPLTRSIDCVRTDARGNNSGFADSTRTTDTVGVGFEPTRPLGHLLSKQAR